MDIYWIKNKKKCGPATVPDVVSLLQMGEITPDTKGWHSGVDGWKPLRELPAMADFISSTPPPLPDTPPDLPEGPAGESAGEAVPAPGTTVKHANVQLHMNEREAADVNLQEMGFPSPWLRLLARLVDTSLYFALGMAVLYMTGEPYDSIYSPQGLLFWTPMLLMEAAFLSRWGTTPGKKILGICVCSFGDRKELAFSRAFIRSLFVFILGMGMMMSLLAPIMMLISYFVLRRRGVCWWDMRALTVPIRKKRTRASRIVFCLGSIYFMTVLSGYFMQPWIAPIMHDLREVSPEYARFMEPFLQDNLGTNGAADSNGTLGPMQRLLDSRKAPAAATPAEQPAAPEPTPATPVPAPAAPAPAPAAEPAPAAPERTPAPEA